MKRWSILGVLFVAGGCAAFFNPHPHLIGEPWAAHYEQNVDCTDPDDKSDMLSGPLPASKPSQWARWVMCPGIHTVGHVVHGEPNVVFIAGDVMSCTNQW